MLNKGMQICIHIDYEEALLTNSSKPAIIRDLAKTWQLTTLEIEEIIKEEKYKPFYMHRTGHWLGLDVHDAGVYKYGESEAILERGNIFTVEPGIYIPEEGLGIRIEDDIVITKEGHENLTRAIPKTVEEIEAFMAN